MKWKIEDWAGNRMFPAKTFKTFDDGWAFVMGVFTDDNDLQEVFVVPV